MLRIPAVMYYIIILLTNNIIQLIAHILKNTLKFLWYSLCE